MNTEPKISPIQLLRSEPACWIGIVTAAIFLTVGSGLLGRIGDPVWFVFLFAWLFAVMLWLSFSVVHHADGLAILLGEPYGTLILTLAVISIEVVMIAAVMMTGEGNPTLARDTMFAVLMIVLAGMMGLALIVGAWRHHEPSYNLQGANAYLGVLIPLAVLTLVLPRFTPSAPGGKVSPTLAWLLIGASVVLYGFFLGIQTMRHRQYFVQPETDGDEEDHHHGIVVQSVGYHALFLVLSMVPIVLLSKNMAKLVEHGISYLGAPGSGVQSNQLGGAARCRSRHNGAKYNRFCSARGGLPVLPR